MQRSSELSSTRSIAPRRDPKSTHLIFGSTRVAEANRAVLRDALGTFRTASGAVRAVIDECSYAVLPTEARVVILTQNPKAPNDAWPFVEEFVRDAVSLAAPATVYTAGLLMTIASRYVMWCVQENGWPLEADVIWSVQGIDLYSTLEGAGRAEGTRRNYRAMLMRISEVLLPAEHGEKVTPLSRKTSAAPYTEREMQSFKAWATNQVTDIKRDRAMLMLTLCAGAGLRSSDVGVVFKRDIEFRGDDVLVNVRDEAPRTVPLLRAWNGWMAALVERADDDSPLWGVPNRTNRANLLSSFTQYTVGAYPDGRRLRNTWLVHHLAAGTPMKDLFRAAGVAKMEQLPRLLAYIPQSPEHTYIQRLTDGGAR